LDNGESHSPITVDKALVDRSVTGDMDAFEELVGRYERRVVAAAIRLCGGREEGEDLAQEAFIKAWRDMAGYRGQASFGSRMMAILTNLWKDRLRKKQLPQTSIDEELEGEEGLIPKQIADTRPGPEGLAESKSVNEALSAMIDELKPEFREALILRDVQGFSYEETAAITGSSLGTVKSRINRARTLMKAKIIEYQEQNPEFFRLNKTGKDKAQASSKKGGEPHEG